MFRENHFSSLLFLFRQRDFVRNSIVVFLVQLIVFSVLIAVVPQQLPWQTLVCACVGLSIISALCISIVLTLCFSPHVKAAALLRKHYEDSDFVGCSKKMSSKSHFMETAVKNLLADYELIQKEHKRLTSLLSHDVRTPLTQVISLCALLEDETDPAMRDEYMNYIKTQSNELLNMLTDTLHLMQAAGIQIKKTDVTKLDFKIVVDRVLKLFFSQMNAKGITVVKDIPAGLEVQAEEKRFMLAIVQLFANAIKLSTPNASIGVKAREASGRIIISVASFDEDNEPLSQAYEAFPSGKVKKRAAIQADDNTPSLHLAEQIIIKHNGYFVAQGRNDQSYFFQMNMPICAN